jgi:hypothetical protein
MPVGFSQYLESKPTHVHAEEPCVWIAATDDWLRSSMVMQMHGRITWQGSLKRMSKKIIGLLVLHQSDSDRSRHAPLITQWCPGSEEGIFMNIKKFVE